MSTMSMWIFPFNTGLPIVLGGGEGFCEEAAWIEHNWTLLSLERKKDDKGGTVYSHRPIPQGSSLERKISFAEEKDRISYCKEIVMEPWCFSQNAPAAMPSVSMDNQSKTESFPFKTATWLMPRSYRGRMQRISQAKVNKCPIYGLLACNWLVVSMR